MRTLASTLLLAAAFTAGATGARATTVTSNTFPGICQAVVTIGPGTDPAHEFVVYNGALARGGINLMLFPNQGAKACYSRNVDPGNCASPMKEWVCTDVTDRADDTVDIK